MWCASLEEHDLEKVTNGMQIRQLLAGLFLFSAYVSLQGRCLFKSIQDQLSSVQVRRCLD